MGNTTKVLSLNDFYTGDDTEMRKWNIYAKLKYIRNEFNHTRLFPALVSLEKIHHDVEYYLSQEDGATQDLAEQIQKSLSKTYPGSKVISTDIIDKKVEHTLRDTLVLMNDVRVQIEQLLCYARDLVSILKGQMRIRETGEPSQYYREGFCLLPFDHECGLLHRYVVRTGGEGLESAVRISSCKGKYFPIKERYEQKRMMLPPASRIGLKRQALFSVETHIPDLPFTETMQPLFRHMFRMYLQDHPRI